MQTPALLHRPGAAAMRPHLVEAGAAGLEVETVSRFDGSRPLGHVRLADTPAVALAGSADDVAEASTTNGDWSIELLADRLGGAPVG